MMPVSSGTLRTRWCARHHSRHTGLTPPIFQQGQRFEPRQLVRRGTAVGCSRFWPLDRMAPVARWRLPRPAHTPVTFLGANCPRPAACGEGARGGEPIANKVQLLLDATLGLINVEQNNIIKVLT